MLSAFFKILNGAVDMKNKNKLFAVLFSAAVMLSAAACGNKGENDGSSVLESTAGISSVESADSNTGTHQPSVLKEMSADENSTELICPDYLVGEWKLKLDVESAEESIKKAAEERMSKTSIVLYSDGKAMGCYGESSVAGFWGVAGDHLYISLNDIKEKFEFTKDIITSVNNPDMSFVK